MVTPYIYRKMLSEQIPVPDINPQEFRQAINGNPTNCIINGARLLNPTTKNVSIDVSFQILDNLPVITSGVTRTGKPIRDSLYHDTAKDYNVTVNFPVTKSTGTGYIEVNNTHELYGILQEAVRQNTDYTLPDIYCLDCNADFVLYILEGTRLKLESEEYAFFNYEIIVCDGGDDGD